MSKIGESMIRGMEEAVKGDIAKEETMTIIANEDKKIIEYIDKEAFREHIDTVYPFTKYGQKVPEYDYAKSAFLMALSEFPAADVAPVVHGKWITTRTIMHDGEYYCNKCGKECTELNRMGQPMWSFCPNCGAKMESVDIKPVKHGRWVYNDDDLIPYCSECMMPQDSECNYCPSCGADMRESEE